jgi:hypothetical protein
MQSILDRYFAVNPQQINPLNLSHTRFVPTTSLTADARFLSDVASKRTPRFYVTLVEGNTSLHFGILIVDKYNGNVAADLEANRHKRNTHASPDEYVDKVYQAAKNLAAELDAEFRPEPEDAVIRTRTGHELLRRAHERAQGIAVARWPVCRPVEVP